MAVCLKSLSPCWFKAQLANIWLKLLAFLVHALDGKQFADPLQHLVGMSIAGLLSLFKVPTKVRPTPDARASAAVRSQSRGPVVVELAVLRSNGPYRWRSAPR